MTACLAIPVGSRNCSTNIEGVRAIFLDFIHPPPTAEILSESHCKKCDSFLWDGLHSILKSTISHFAPVHAQPTKQKWMTGIPQWILRRTPQGMSFEGISKSKI
jgi:hypothetical protein